MLSKCGRCSGAIYSQYNMGNLLSLSREGDITSSCKGIMDNLSMTYDGCRLVSVSDSAPGPSVTGSADFRDGVSEAVEYTYDRNGNMTSDLNRKVSLISYNRQNRPARMIHAGGRMSGNADAHPVTGNGEHVVGRNLEIGGGINGMEIARPGSSLMTVRPLYSFRSYYSL